MGRLNFIIAIFITGLTLSVCSTSARAQQVDEQTIARTFPKEHLTLVANADVILSGEMLAYSIVCQTHDKLVNISDIAYVELVADSKTSVFKQKLRLTNGKTYGDFFLPTTLKTGHYKLITYTNWSLNNDVDAFFQKDIYIINPYLNAIDNNLKKEFGENEGYIEISTNQDFRLNGKNERNGIKITTDSETYQKRHRVNFQIESLSSSLSNVNSTVLVKKLDSFEIQKFNVKPKIPNKPNVDAHLPEMRGELIQGSVLNAKTKEPVANQTVSLSIPSEHLIYKSSKTNSKGVFYLNVFEPYEQEKAIIQVVSENRDDFKIAITPKIFDRYEELDFYPLKLNKNLESYISKNSIYNQVESAYYNLKKDSVLGQSAIISFYGKPDIIYVLDDFTRFSSVKETFIEVVQAAAIRNVNDGYQFLVYDYDNPFANVFKTIKPLLLFDGMQIQDEKIVVNYNPEAIESVSLVKGVYSFGSSIYNGIIDIKLKQSSNLNLSGSYMTTMNIQKPVAQKEYFKQSYSVESNRIPDFRTQLLWEPEFVMNANSQSLEFYTSDVSGYYMIEVKTLLADGKSIILNKIFKVTDD